MQAYSVPCWWVGWWLWRAGCISQNTYLLYDIRIIIIFTNLYKHHHPDCLWRGEALGKRDMQSRTTCSPGEPFLDINSIQHIVILLSSSSASASSRLFRMKNWNWFWFLIAIHIIFGNQTFLAKIGQIHSFVFVFTFFANRKLRKRPDMSAIQNTGVCPSWENHFYSRRLILVA